MKHKMLLFLLLLFTVLTVTACNAADVEDAAANVATITPEKAATRALLDFLEGQGAPVNHMDMKVVKIDGDYARIEVISTDPDSIGGFNAFMRHENGLWTTVVSGSSLEMENAAALGIPRSVWPDAWLEQGDAPAVLGQPPITFSEDGCPITTVAAQTQSLVDEARGFCLLYPASHIVVQLESGNTEIVVGSLMNHTDPRLSIVVVELAGRSLEQVIDEFLAGYEGFDIAQTPLAVDDEKGIQLENIPGQDLYRNVMVTHDGFLYQLSFAPYDPGIVATIAEAEHLYRVVIDSFRFLG